MSNRDMGMWLFLGVILVVGIGTAIAAGAWHLAVAPASAEAASGRSGEVFVSGEVLKAAVSFVLLVIGGTIIKIAVDTTLERQRERRADAHQEHDRRQAVLSEFVEVYSGFYAARKLYHSAISSKNSVYRSDPTELAKLKRTLLEDIVELEGRYGAVKMLALTAFGLPTRFMGVKNADELRAEIVNERDPGLIVRLKFDLLGEAYDDWRHALEHDRKIELAVTVWDTYEPLLEFVLTAPLDPRVRAA